MISLYEYFEVMNLGRHFNFMHCNCCGANLATAAIHSEVQSMNSSESSLTGGECIYLSSVSLVGYCY